MYWTFLELAVEDIANMADNDDFAMYAISHTIFLVETFNGCLDAFR